MLAELTQMHKKLAEMQMENAQLTKDLQEARQGQQEEARKGQQEADMLRQQMQGLRDSVSDQVAQLHRLQAGAADPGSAVALELQLHRCASRLPALVPRARAPYALPLRVRHCSLVLLVHHGAPAAGGGLRAKGAARTRSTAAQGASHWPRAADGAVGGGRGSGCGETVEDEPALRACFSSGSFCSRLGSGGGGACRP